MGEYSAGNHEEHGAVNDMDTAFALWSGKVVKTKQGQHCTHW